MQQTLSHSTIPLDIQFRHMPKNKALQQTALQQLDSFGRFNSHGGRCHIVFDRTHSSQHGWVYQVTIRLNIPGQPLYVTHSTESGGSKELLFATLNDAFHDLRRQMMKTRTKRYHHRRIAA